MITEFYKKNIERKKECMQKEHEQVLQLLYQNAVEQKTVDNFEFRPYVIPHISYLDLMKVLGYADYFVLDVCLADLVHFGFAYRQQYTSGIVEYGITKLGLKYIEYSLKESN